MLPERGLEDSLQWLPEVQLRSSDRHQQVSQLRTHCRRENSKSSQIMAMILDRQPHHASKKQPTDTQCQRARAKLVCRCHFTPMKVSRTDLTSLSSIRIALARSALRIHWTWNVINQICLKDFQRRHLLPNPELPVPYPFCPLQSTLVAVVATSTGLCGCKSIRAQYRFDLLRKSWSFDCSHGHPACKIGFEGALVDVTGVDGLAGGLD
jgi:hypothetical protein